MFWKKNKKNNFSVSIHEKSLECPICAHNLFLTKKFRVTGDFLQSFDLEAFGTEGIMLIRQKCSHILHFADPEQLTIRPEITED